MDRVKLAAKVLLKVMDRNRKKDLSDELIVKIVKTSYAITDEFLKQKGEGENCKHRKGNENKDAVDRPEEIREQGYF